MVVLLSQAAKYIPGNIAHHVGRVVLAKRYGISATSAAFSIFVETLLVVAVAASIAAIALWLVGDQVFRSVPHPPSSWSLASLVIVAILAPMAGHRILQAVLEWWARRKGVSVASVNMPSARTFWLVGVLYSVNFAILGLVVQLIAVSVFDTPSGGLLLLAGVFAVAWIVGFITPGAPAGLGVREVVLVAGLTPVFGTETAVGVAGVLRVVTVLGDGVAFLFGLGLQRTVGTG